VIHGAHGKPAAFRERYRSHGNPAARSQISQLDAMPVDFRHGLRCIGLFAGLCAGLCATLTDG